jgi:hypothetical protein
MPYLDDRRRVNGWIAAFTIPALALFAHWLFQSAVTADSGSALAEVEAVLLNVSRLAWLAPLFVLIQASMIVRGTATASWQNILCVVLTLAGGLMLWSSQLA